MPDSQSPSKSGKKPLTTAQKNEKTAFLMFCGEELKAKKTRQHPVNRVRMINVHKFSGYGPMNHSLFSFIAVL